MYLSKIHIKNYRLLSDALIDVDKKTTLIVGRNNTGKTSCFDCIKTVLKGASFSYDDYPLEKRNELLELITRFMSKEISFTELCDSISIITVVFYVDYSTENEDEFYGALAPFIIDVDLDTIEAMISVEYRFKVDEKTLWNYLESSYYDNENYSPNYEDAKTVISECFTKLFELRVYAINPNNPEDKQKKSINELAALLPFCYIPAERSLGEDGGNNKDPLGELINKYFEINEEDIDSDVAEEVLKLREAIEKSNKVLQNQSSEMLSSIVSKAVGFGYPNSEDLQLGVITKLSIDEQIKNQTKLSYTLGSSSEVLPSTHNGLGYKNLIKIQFILAAFSKEIKNYGNACIPLLFIEEPESHMHPQMQQAFADYIETFLKELSDIRVQSFLTSHSAHIANTVDFSKIRYAQKTCNGVLFKNLNTFVQEDGNNIKFIRKYLTLTKCDMFFADKVIFVEGASERLLLPDMIEKCEAAGMLSSQGYKLSDQYYALIEIGGAYAHIFVPFVRFLGIPCLILTDLDSVAKNSNNRYSSVPVSDGDTTSNATIKWWMKEVKHLSKDMDSVIKLSDIIALSDEEKTIGKCHIEFQTNEEGLCGRSLEEAVMNVNRAYYDLEGISTDKELKFDGKCKTDFALKLIYECKDYNIPKYIQSGLEWLYIQKVLE